MTLVMHKAHEEQTMTLLKDDVAVVTGGGSGLGAMNRKFVTPLANSGSQA
jgi:hypothetical protein